MTWEYLNADATSFAAANWSSPSNGFADGATLGIVSGNQTIDTALDQSGLTDGINKLRIGWDFEGVIGTPTASLQVDCDNGADPMISYAAKAGALYLAASGDDDLITSFQQAGLGRSFLQGGTFTNVGVGRGKLIADSSTVVTNLLAAGGEIEIKSHATTPLTMCRVVGGFCRLHRQATTVEVGPEARVVQLNPDADATEINLWGGQLDWRGGAITTLNWFAGTPSLAFVPKQITVGTVNIYPTAAQGEIRSILDGVSVTTTNYVAGGPTAGVGLGR